MDDDVAVAEPSFKKRRNKGATGSRRISKFDGENERRWFCQRRLESRAGGFRQRHRVIGKTIRTNRVADNASLFVETESNRIAKNRMKLGVEGN